MFIADLHIHSKYSRATSKECIPEHLELWARRKGIDLLGTGDFTHPTWREELKEKLIPAEEGLYRLKEEYRLRDDNADDSKYPRFVVSGEISSIYKKNDKVRKVHNLILLPSLEMAEALSHKLEQIGNLHSDGRPILGLDSRDLLEITLEVCPQAIFIPAHIWTPHFSLFGAFSGFDTIEACFEDMTPYIHALETGLSSDPPMNWRLSALDTFALVSNSDAHSPSKLGREANLFDTELSYPAIAQALENKEKKGLAGTIEFFPEEGKYHFDGHRACKQCLTPAEADLAAGKCPSCGKKLTIGVLHRVEQLADRPEGFVLPSAKGFESLIPLPEVIAASTGFSAAGVKVKARYDALLHGLGAEFYILRKAPLEDIERISGPCVAEGIRRMRCGKVELLPGYDGEYGKIHLLDQSEIDALSGQLCFFGGQSAKKKRNSEPQALTLKQDIQKSETIEQEALPAKARAKRSALAGLNEEQLAAATVARSITAVIAGPGTGKTKTLVSRIAYLIEEGGAHPSEITAVTFTNKAAAEMRARLEAHFGGKRAIKGLTIGTFHSICLQLLSEQGAVTLIDEYEAAAIAQELLRERQQKLSARRFLQAVSKKKNGLNEDTLPVELFEAYQARLKEYGVRDYDDLLLEALALLEEKTEAKGKRKKCFTHLLVDEFQDVNDLQYRLVQAWGQQSKSLFVIGDPDQAIYGFRGSSAKCFDHFLKEHAEAAVIRLIKNYRSTPEIINCARSVISGTGGIEADRSLEAQIEKGNPVSLLTAKDDFNEAVYIAKEINRMVGGVDMLDTEVMTARRNEDQIGFSDIAVLYRTHRQAEVIEKCLQKEGIPYVVVGKEESLLSDPLVRGTLGFFRSLLEGMDRMSLRTCLKEIFQCPEPVLRRLLSTPQVTVDWDKTLPEELREMAALKRYIEAAEQFRPLAQKEKPQKLLEAFLNAIGTESNPAMERLLNTAMFHSDMSQFLQNLVLGREGDITRSGSRHYVPDAVSLMTLHGSKGLEFPIVFLSGVKHGALPLERPGAEVDEEEERRLFYVGITRAKSELIILTTKESSVFLQTIPADSLHLGEAKELRSIEADRQMRLF